MSLADSLDNSSDPPNTPQSAEKTGDSRLAQSPSLLRFSHTPFEPKSSSGPDLQPQSLSRVENLVDLGATTSLPLSHQFDDILPVAASQHPPSRDASSQLSSTDATKRRPLPTPPSLLQHSSSVSHSSDPIPSSPPPPYSRFLPDDDPISMTRDFSRIPLTSHISPEPEAPVIMTPLPNEQGAHTRAPCDSFLCHSPPANTWIAVETLQSEYVLLVRLPGFTQDGITIATKRRRILHVVADSWEPEGGHFERRVSFGYDAELTQVRAEFDGEMLRIVVPRRITVA